ncbi:hypothetical protein FJT64_022787 [Amphibalanus amphitrite]|uniref:Uncharacterized protein n=1 Tax=Amphibalanus amphitrite TaxID=1232801 RepID=A0A6A4WPD3_AMPAM|nr:hypothetical protein FJT64_022787 [Amphibalanus amphitrite]
MTLTGLFGHVISGLAFVGFYDVTGLFGHVISGLAFVGFYDVSSLFGQVISGLAFVGFYDVSSLFGQVISGLAFVGFAARLIQLHVQEVPELGPNTTELLRLPPLEEGPTLDQEDLRLILSEQTRDEIIIIGSLLGVSLVSLLAALLLMVAVRKTNRYLALPFMIWTILCTAAAGLFGVSLLVAFPAVRAQLRHHPPAASHRTHRHLDIVLPFVFIVIMFKLYTWWLIVVFDFYNRIRFARGGPPFEAVPMQSA